MKIRSIPLILALGASLARADFQPIVLTPETFNQDIIVENTALRPIGRATTATMDGGTNNSGATWYETGYNTNSGATATGIPQAGSTFTHQSLAGYRYAMAPSFSAPNAFFIQGNQVTNATITLSTPTAFGLLSFLASGGNGGVTVNYVIRHADATTQTGTIAVGDWFNGSSPAWNAQGRVNVGNGNFDNVNNNNPRLYSYNIAIVNTASAVTSVEVSYASGGGRVGIFALSGAPTGLTDVDPIAVTGYNYDMVVEATAPQGGALRTATTASMDGGTNNTGNTWFERGYDPYNPNVGLPPAGSTITSVSLPDHHYTMPASYTSFNAVLVDTNQPVANLTLAFPSNYSALSFLSATANGTVTNQCVMQYADGTSETNIFLSRDWFNNSPFAFVSAGRVNLDSRTLNNVNGSNPRLYEAQFALNNLNSPITNVVLRWIGGSINSRAVVLAVSGSTNAVAPLMNTPLAPQAGYEGTNVTFSTWVAGTAPFTFQWQRGADGVFTNILDDARITGAGTTNLSIANIELADTADYRLVAMNGAGALTSSVAPLVVLSTLPDVTAPGDAITLFGGTTPANETVDRAIDDTTLKYLNYGSGPTPGGAPFVGPVGFTVTPTSGTSIVKGMRIYTANDGVERDPVNFSLEGSTDGATFTLIASNALRLPDIRNGGGVALNPLGQSLQQVLFNNNSVFSSYRVTFYDVKNSTNANSMQIGEVELLGTVIPPGPRLTVGADGEWVTVSSDVEAILEITSELKGASTVWEEYGPIFPGVDGTLYFLAEPGTAKFFRARLP